VVVGEPVGEDFLLTGTVGAEDGEQARIQIGQGFKVLPVDALDPLAILLRVPTVANAYEQRIRFLWLKNTQPGRTA
jgi:hypothetical protein